MFGFVVGKGVFIFEIDEEVFVVLKSVMVDKEFGDVGDEVVVEEYFFGFEIFVFVFSDGYIIVLMFVV